MGQIIKLFIFVTILFGTCKAKENAVDFEQKCTNEHQGELLDPTVCILNQKNVQSAPNDPTEISISINNIHVNEIDVKSNQISMSMEIAITWSEERLLMATQIMYKWKFLDLDSIWSPEIVVGKYDIPTMTAVAIRKDYKNSTIALELIELEAARKCQMDFQFFPFDKHECIFEVCNV